MRTLLPTRGTRAALAASAAALLVSGLAISTPADAGQANTASITYQVSPIAINSNLGRVSASSFPTPGECVQTAGLACYTPAIFHTAYQIPWTIKGQLAGTGETVVIVDAYGSPTVASDLATFDNTFGLPPANLNVFYPGGKPTFNPNSANEVGWAEETSLDVQTVHSLAPGATIDLVVAPSNNGNALNNAQAYAVDKHLGQVITESYGAPEAAIAGGGNNLQLQQAHAIYMQAAKENISVFASSGDSGAGNGYSYANALYPASDPYVTAAGGTDLFVKGDTNAKLSGTKAGTYSSEYTWADFNPSTCPFGCQYGPLGATGGAPSKIFSAPSYQTSSSMRTTSDVAFNASVYTATMIYLGFLGKANNNFYFFGGTSEASPSWAAITADINQARGSAIGLFAPTLYKLASNPKTYAADFHDITVGENNDPANGVGYSAGKGYDLPTGLGTPIVTGLISSLAQGASFSMQMP